jgi:hypothetical protein
MRPQRLFVASRLAFFFVVQALAAHELALRSSLPGFYETEIDLFALFSIAVFFAALPLTFFYLRRLIARTPVVAADRFGLHFDCNLLGPGFLPWIFVEKLETGGCGFSRCLVVRVNDSGLARLGFWRRLFMSLGVGGRTCEVRLPESMYPGSCESLCELIGRFHGSQCSERLAATR